MVGSHESAGGFWAFLPYALTVIGAGIGIVYATSGFGTANPLIWLVIGAVAGRAVAFGVVRLARVFGSGN